MERIAFLLASTGRPVYWREIFICAGAVTALLTLLSLRLFDRRRIWPMLLFVPLAAALSLAAARWIHWYCCFENYESLRAAMTDLSGGGYSLIGVFVGTLCAAGLLWALRLEKDLGALLDELAGAGALGIAAGRMGELFGAADRGKMVFSSMELQRLPFAAAVVNPVSGAYEWRFAAFCAQSLWAAAIFALLLLRRVLRTGKRGEKYASGGDFLVFLSLYCLGQILLDSTRYDALFLRSNGFVSLEQIVGLTVMTVLTAALSVTAIRRGGFRAVYPVSWALFLGGFGLTGYMEYYVQRHGEAYLFAYGLMAAGLSAVFIAFVILYVKARRPAESAATTENVPAEA